MSLPLRWVFPPRPPVHCFPLDFTRSHNETKIQAGALALFPVNTQKSISLVLNKMPTPIGKG
jgi:hypothetical protein